MKNICFDDRTSAISIWSGMVLYLRCLWEKRKGFLYAKIISESECKQNFFCVKDFSNYLVSVAKLNLHRIHFQGWSQHRKVRGERPQPFNPKWCRLLGGVLFVEMKFALSNFLSIEDLSISYESLNFY